MGRKQSPEGTSGIGRTVSVGSGGMDNYDLEAASVIETLSLLRDAIDKATVGSGRMRLRCYVIDKDTDERVDVDAVFLPTEMESALSYAIRRITQVSGTLSLIREAIGKE